MFVKTNFLVKLISAYINRFKVLIFISIIAGISIFFITSALLPSLSHHTERIAITGRFTTEQLPETILNKIGDGLTEISENGLPSPAIASSWDTPDKGKTWIFHIDNNLYWQDGKKLTSDSINYNFSDVEIEKPDLKTIKFKLKEVFISFPSIVARPIFKKGLLGTGEWRVKKIKIAGGFVSELVLLNHQKEKIIYKFYPTYKLASTAYKLGKVDKVEDLLDISEFKSWPNTNVETVPNKHQIVTIFFNYQDKFLGEKSLRQALAYAIDKDALGVRALSPIPPDSWAYNPQVKEYLLDADHARELLAELSKDTKKDLKIKLISSPDLLSIAEKVSKDWGTIGVKSSVQLSSLIPEDFQAFLTILDVPVDPDQYTLWHSTQTESNISGYASPRVDKLLEVGRVEGNFEDRKKTYLDFQRFLLEDLPAAFLIYPNYYTISRK